MENKITSSIFENGSGEFVVVGLEKKGGIIKNNKNTKSSTTYCIFLDKYAIIK